MSSENFNRNDSDNYESFGQTPADCKYKKHLISGCSALITLLLSIILFYPITTNAQHDFRFYSDGYTLDAFDQDRAILKVFLIAFEIGSIASWNHDINDFRLSYGPGLKETKVVAYTPELRVSEIGTEPLLLSIFFIIPKNAMNAYLIFPKRYGGLKTKLF